jgi:hypothetical protein
MFVNRERFYTHPVHSLPLNPIPVIHQAMLHYADKVLGDKILLYKQFFSLPQSYVSKEETPNTL